MCIRYLLALILFKRLVTGFAVIDRCNFQDFQESDWIRNVAVAWRKCKELWNTKKCTTKNTYRISAVLFLESWKCSLRSSSKQNTTSACLIRYVKSQNSDLQLTERGNMKFVLISTTMLQFCHCFIPSSVAGSSASVSLVPIATGNSCTYIP